MVCIHPRCLPTNPYRVWIGTCNPGGQNQVLPGPMETQGESVEPSQVSLLHTGEPSQLARARAHRQKQHHSLCAPRVQVAQVDTSKIQSKFRAKAGARHTH